MCPMQRDFSQNTGLIKKRGNGAVEQSTKLNAINYDASLTSEQVASLGLTAIREMFPVREMESDLATRLRHEYLVDIVNAVGPEKFLEAVKQAIAMSDSRWHCTVHRIRQCAGLREPKFVDPAYKAWQTVTEVVRLHVKRGPEGNYRLEPHVTIGFDDKAMTTPVPEISESIRKAVRALGGWQALATCPPEFWAQRMKEFIQLYEE